MFHVGPLSSGMKRKAEQQTITNQWRCLLTCQQTSVIFHRLINTDIFLSLTSLRGTKNQKRCPDCRFSQPLATQPFWLSPHVVIINDIGLIKLSLRHGCDDCHNCRLDKPNSLASEKNKCHRTPELQKKIAAFEVAWRAGKLLQALTSKGFMSCNSKKSRREEEDNFLIAWVAFCAEGSSDLGETYPPPSPKKERYTRAEFSQVPKQRADTPSGWCQEIKTASCPVGDECKARSVGSLDGAPK